MNTATRISIYNMALSAVGNSKFVQSLTEGSQQSNTCNLFWDAVIDQVLEDFPWGFALRFTTLQLGVLTTPGWLYTYVYPHDCIKARLVTPLETPNVVVPGYLASPRNFWDMWRGQYRIPFAIIDDSVNGGLCIATNLPDAVLAYTANVRLITLWSASFVNCVTWLLASKIVSPLAASPQFAVTAGQAYEAALLKAGANNMNEGVERPEPESEFILARR